MKARTILQDYLQKKREISILEMDLHHLKSIVFIKTAKYGDTDGGDSLKLDERYNKLIEEKQDIELRIAILKRDVARVEKVLELMQMTHPHECNAMLLKHVQNKKNDYIGMEIGLSRNIITNKIRFAEEEFERLIIASKHISA